MIISCANLEKMCLEVLCRAGIPEPKAASIATVLVSADMRGINSHGVIRIARYIDCVQSGGIHPAHELVVLEETPCVLRCSANGGLGIPAACETVERLIVKGLQQPLVAATLNHSDHYGAAGYYALKCAERGLFGFSMSNTLPLVAITGSAAAAIGNNPFAYSAPAGKYRALLYDVCMSVVASGKIQLAAAAGQPIPEGWIMTADGQPTTDPQQIYHGAVMLPFGAHKGYGLAVLVELLAGVLANASILSEVHSWNMQPGRDSGTGHFFMTINPEFFGGRQRCVERAEQMITELLSAPKAPGVERIYYPGEIEFEKEARALREGLDLPDESYSELLRAQKLL